MPIGRRPNGQLALGPARAAGRRNGAPVTGPLPGRSWPGRPPSATPRRRAWGGELVLRRPLVGPHAPARTRPGRLRSPCAPDGAGPSRQADVAEAALEEVEAPGPARAKTGATSARRPTPAARRRWRCWAPSAARCARSRRPAVTASALGLAWPRSPRWTTTSGSPTGGSPWWSSGGSRRRSRGVPIGTGPRGRLAETIPRRAHHRPRPRATAAALRLRWRPPDDAGALPAGGRADPVLRAAFRAPRP